MFFMKKISSFHRFLAFIICTPIFAFLSSQSDVFALDFPAVDTPLSNGYFSFNYSLCTYTYLTNENRPYYNCSGDSTLSGYNFSSSTNEDGSITQHWRINLGSPNDYVDNHYFAITRLNFSGFSSITDNFTKPFFLKLESEYSPFLGNARSLFYPDPNNRYSLRMGGFNSWFYNSTRGEYVSCPDMNSNECQFRYDWDTTTGLGGFYYLSKNSGLPSNWSTINNIYIVHNYYDTANGGSYVWSYWSGTPYSVIYLLNPRRDAYLDTNGNLYLYFDTTFYTTDEYFDMSANDTPGADVNDAITAEQEYITNDINNANSSNDSLLGLVISNIPFPFSSWWALFTDNSCVDISTVPGWFGLSSQHICSPWSSSIRSTLTPVISVMSGMLLFGFVIHFMRGGGTPGDNISYGHGKFKGLG